MDDPRPGAFGSPGALEELMRRQRQLDEILKPSAASQLLKQIEQAQSFATKYDLFSRSSATAQLMERMEQAASLSRKFDDLTRMPKLLEFTHSSAYLTAIEASTKYAAIADLSAKYDLATLAAPRHAEILRLSELAASRIAPFEFAALPKPWASVLSDRMAAIPASWALADGLEESATAFARLSRLSDVTRQAVAYSDETAAIFLDELGQPSASPDEPETIEEREGRFDDAGRSRELIAFPPSRYGEILVSAGYAVAFPPPPAVVAEEGPMDPVRFSPQTGSILQSLEAHMRDLVATRLHALEGDAWIKRRVPEPVRNKWVEKRQAAQAAGKPVFAPIQYADFMDLADIIAGGANWPVFAAAFANKENLRLSLLRLYYVRNDIAHARPISMTDELVVITEGTLMFRAMGLEVRYSE